MESPLRIAVVGLSGRMGREIAALVAGRADVDLAGGVGRASIGDLPDLARRVDVVIDFSQPKATPAVIAAASAAACPLVIGTTGLDEALVYQLRTLSGKVPVWFARNMSTGVGALQRVLPLLAEALAGFDIEIVEAHHRHKVDAPSGTALMLADSILAGLPDVEAHPLVYGREGHAPRQVGEIGIHAVRGGGNPGEHNLIFASDEEEIRVSHRAFTRQVFAAGAIRAAQAIRGRAPGWYGPE